MLDAFDGFDPKMAEIAAKAEITAAQLQSRMEIDMAKNKTTRDKAAADTNIKLTAAQLKAQNIEAGFDTY